LLAPFVALFQDLGGAYSALADDPEEDVVSNDRISSIMIRSIWHSESGTFYRKRTRRKSKELLIESQGRIGARGPTWSSSRASPNDLVMESPALGRRTVLSAPRSPRV
jgi:hypothetical protein